MILRDEKMGDAAAIHDVTARAFAGQPYSDGSEPAIIARLREAGALRFSHVAEDAGAIVGHVALSDVTVGGTPGWLGLGPISVAPDRQGTGVGSALMKAALDFARAEGAKGVVLVGDPGYYSRFGFVSGLVGYAGLDARFVQALSFGAAEARGEIIYHSAFG